MMYVRLERRNGVNDEKSLLRGGTFALVDCRDRPRRENSYAAQKLVRLFPEIAAQPRICIVRDCVLHHGFTRGTGSVRGEISIGKCQIKDGGICALHRAKKVFELIDSARLRETPGKTKFEARIQLRIPVQKTVADIQIVAVRIERVELW